MMKENQKGFKLPKNESNNSHTREESPNKEKRQTNVINDEKKCIKEESTPIKPEEGPIVNGIETDPTVISNLLKEVPPIHHVTEIKKDETKDIVPISDVNPVPNPDGRKLEHHRSEKKRKKDKHKHKDKDRSKDEKEKKKKHKDKDRNKDSERHKSKEMISESPNAPLKFTISKDKITPPSSIHQSTPITSESTLPTSLKIKIPKDRIKPDTLPMLNKSQGSGSLKITISKDKIIENDSSSGSSSRKRDRDSGDTHGPMSKVSKSSSGHSSSRSSDGNKQNGRHHSNKLQVRSNNNIDSRFSSVQSMININQHNQFPMAHHHYFHQNQYFYQNFPPPNMQHLQSYQVPYNANGLYQYYPPYAMYNNSQEMYAPPIIPSQNMETVSDERPPLPQGPPPDNPPPPPPSE